MKQRSKPTPVNDFNDDTEGKQVYHKTEAIQNLSQHHPGRDNKLSIPEQEQLLHIVFGQTKFVQKFRFGAYGEITPNLITLQNRPSNSQSVFQFSSASEDKAEYQHHR